MPSTSRGWEIARLAVPVILVVITFYLNNLPYTAAHVAAALLLFCAFGPLFWLAWQLPTGGNGQRRKRHAALTVVVILWLATEGPPISALWKGVPQRPPVRLYYADQELDWHDDPIALERGCALDVCMRMHVMPWPNPEWFGLYGIWMKKPAHIPPVGTGGAVYIEFSEVVKERNNWCQLSGRPPHGGYKIALMCGGQPQPRGDIWVLPWFNFAPVPTGPLHIRITIEYGDIISEPAEFTLRPP